MHLRYLILIITALLPLSFAKVEYKLDFKVKVGDKEFSRNANFQFSCGSQIPDKEEIKAMIKKKLSQAMAKQQSKETTQLTVSSVASTPSSSQSTGYDPEISPTDDGCDIRYNGSCFWLIWQKCGFEEATALCRGQNGEPAVTEDADIYDKVIKLILKEKNQLNKTVSIWLGMSLNSDGTFFPTDTYTDWLPDSPKVLGWKIIIRFEREQHGMLCFRPDFYGEGVLCQRRDN